MAKKQHTSHRKFTFLNILLVWLCFSGSITNLIYDDNLNSTDKEIITSTPSLAFYKDGKALNALCPEWNKYADPE